MLKKIFIVSSEATPYSKTGGLADVVSAISEEFSKNNLTVKLFLPYYKKVDQLGLKLKKDTLKVSIFEDVTFFSHIKSSRLEIVFIKSDSIYRDFEYSFSDCDYYDNCKRFSIFSRAVVEYINEKKEFPDILHCNDWQTGILPGIIKYAGLDKKIKTVFTIHNLAYQGIYEIRNMHWTGLPHNYFELFDGDYKQINFLKSAIINSDLITTVSPEYAKEILTKKFSCGLKKYLLHREKDIYGILNGVDYDIWNPKTDKFLKYNFSFENIEEKDRLKKYYLKEWGFSDLEKPLISIISRLATQKGIDVLYQGEYCVIEKILNELDLNIVIIGTGESWAENKILELQKKYKNLKAFITFNEELSHQVEAASDLFLMPSFYEPCGLNQIYSLKYGTVPIVSNTGGLKNSVVDFNCENGTGFFIDDLDYDTIFKTVQFALDLKNTNKDKFLSMIKCGMSQDFSWTKVAKKYIDLFKIILD